MHPPGGVHPVPIKPSHFLGVQTQGDHTKALAFNEFVAERVTLRRCCRGIKDETVRSVQLHHEGVVHGSHVVPVTLGIRFVLPVGAEINGAQAEGVWLCSMQSTTLLGSYVAIYSYIFMQ